MTNAEISDKIRAIAEAAVAGGDIEIVHQELAGTKRNLTIRIFIDKPGGVTIDDCTNVSRSVEAVLDAEDLIPTAYVLEVSSPGLERELYSLSDFEKHVGDKAKVKVKEAIASKKAFVGRIMGVEGDTVIFDDRSGEPVRIAYQNVAKANLRVDLEKEFGKKRDNDSQEIA